MKIVGVAFDDGEWKYAESVDSIVETGRIDARQMKRNKLWCRPRGRRDSDKSVVWTLSVSRGSKPLVEEENVNCVFLFPSLIIPES